MSIEELISSIESRGWRLHILASLLDEDDNNIYWHASIRLNAYLYGHSAEQRTAHAALELAFKNAQRRAQECAPAPTVSLDDIYNT